jgi:undecaprenyl diphosphate synthase
MEVIQKIAIYPKERGIGTITFFAFSNENWNRKEKEVSYLMSLIERFYIEKIKLFLIILK